MAKHGGTDDEEREIALFYPQSGVGRGLRERGNGMAMGDLTSDQIEAMVATATTIAPLTVRKMFGTTCLYDGEVMLGIIHASGLYLKIDDTTRGSYDATDQPVFAPKPGTGYRSFRLVPAEATVTQDGLRPWLTDAIGAANRLARR